MGLELSNFYEPDNKDRIIGFILSVGSSYPSEIANKLMISIDSVSAAINQLINSGDLRRITPNRENPQPLIRCRIQELNDKGIEGFREFAERNWIIVTLEGVKRFAEKHKGEHRQIKGAYFSTYDDDLFSPDFDYHSVGL